MVWWFKYIKLKEILSIKRKNNEEKIKILKKLQLLFICFSLIYLQVSSILSNCFTTSWSSATDHIWLFYINITYIYFNTLLLIVRSSENVISANSAAGCFLVRPGRATDGLMKNRNTDQRPLLIPGLRPGVTAQPLVSGILSAAGRHMAFFHLLKIIIYPTDVI